MVHAWNEKRSIAGRKRGGVAALDFGALDDLIPPRPAPNEHTEPVRCRWHRSRATVVLGRDMIGDTRRMKRITPAERSVHPNARVAAAGTSRDASCSSTPTETFRLPSTNFPFSFPFLFRLNFPVWLCSFSAPFLLFFFRFFILAGTVVFMNGRLTRRGRIAESGWVSIISYRKNVNSESSLLRFQNQYFVFYL